MNKIKNTKKGCNVKKREKKVSKVKASFSRKKNQVERCQAGNRTKNNNRRVTGRSRRPRITRGVVLRNARSRVKLIQRRGYGKKSHDPGISVS